MRSSTWSSLVYEMTMTEHSKSNVPPFWFIKSVNCLRKKHHKPSAPHHQLKFDHVYLCVHRDLCALCNGTHSRTHLCDQNQNIPKIMNKSFLQEAHAIQWIGRFHRDFHRSTIV